MLKPRVNIEFTQGKGLQVDFSEVSDIHLIQLALQDAMDLYEERKWDKNSPMSTQYTDYKNLLEEIKKAWYE